MNSGSTSVLTPSSEEVNPHRHFGTSGHWSRQAALARQALQSGSSVLFFAMLAQKGGAR